MDLPLGLGAATAAFLNGIDRIREQAVVAVVLAVAAFALKWALVRPLGPGGVAWATAVAYVVVAVLPILLVIRAACRDLVRPASAESAAAELGYSRAAGSDARAPGGVAAMSGSNPERARRP